jgi:hypothetical protein
MAEQRIIDKIQKLLRLADPERGGTDAERELALQRANELMAKHNLEQFELTEQSAPGDVQQENDTISGSNNQWKVTFMLATADVCLVSGYYQAVGKRQWKVVFIGRADNIAFVRQLHEHLIPWLEHEARTSFQEISAMDPLAKPRSFKRAFFESATWRIRGRLESQRRQASGKFGTEIVRNEAAANKRFLEQSGINLRRQRGRQKSSEAGHATGQEAGNRADISPGRKLGAGS